jgi:hypothetical protein
LEKNEAKKGNEKQKKKSKAKAEKARKDVKPSDD